MAVTDEQVAALRALLTGDAAENRRLVAEFRRDGSGAGYSALVNAAFSRRWTAASERQAHLPDYRGGAGPVSGGAGRAQLAVRGG
jgi:hypothetical protein